MAIYVMRSATTTWDKSHEAVEWFSKLVEYVKKTYPDLQNCEVLGNTGGDLSEFHFFAKIDSLGKWEELLQQVAEDQGYLGIIQEGQDAQIFTGFTERVYPVLT